MTCQLYRHFDAQGRLLYVGISLSAVSRLAQHANGSHWASMIARVDVETHPTREAALDAERAAILREKPMHNVVHNRAQRSGELMALPEELPLSFWSEDGEPHLIGEFEDADGDTFRVDFSWAEGGPDTIEMDGFQHICLDDAGLEWLIVMREVAQEWSQGWRATKQYAEFIKRTE